MHRLAERHRCRRAKGAAEGVKSRRPLLLLLLLLLLLTFLLSSRGPAALVQI